MKKRPNQPTIEIDNIESLPRYWLLDQLATGTLYNFVRYGTELGE